MDNSFLSYLLFLCLALIVITYLNQNKNNASKNNKNNKYNKNHQNTHQQQLLHNAAINYNLKLASSHKVSGMPIHRVGPVLNFHQHFTKRTNNKSYNTVMGCGNPTGIPEMGWRNMYISNNSIKDVDYEDPFSGLITRNYLDNLDNVDNIYRK